MTGARIPGWRRLRAGTTSADARTWWLAGIVAATALLVLGAVPDVARHPVGPWVTLAVFVGFVVSEPFRFHIESGDHAVSFTPSDLPLAVGLLTLSPWTLVTARLVAAVVGLVRRHNRRPVKVALNLAAFAVEVAVAVAVLDLLVEPAAPAGPRLWLGMTVSLLSALAVSGTVVALAIANYEGGHRGRVRRELTHLATFYGPGAVLGSAVAIPLAVVPWLVLPVLACVPVLWGLLHAYGSLTARYLDLDGLHSFSREISGSPRLEDVAETAVVAVGRHLRAREVALVVWDDGGDLVVGATELAAILPTEPTDAGWAAHLRSGEPFRFGPGIGVHRGIEGIAVPIGVGDDVIGLLCLAGRSGAQAGFGPDDLTRLRPVGQQLGVALRRGQLHRRIQHEARHDTLTGLANRQWFEHWVRERITDGGRCGALLMIDLNRFKDVNDTLGHGAGDRLLVEIADRLRSATCGQGLVARFGGDEFTLYVPDVTGDELAILVRAVGDALEDPLSLDGTKVSVGGSIGVALCPDHGEDVTTLLRRADIAMYEAKRRRDGWVVFHPELEMSDDHRLTMVADLRAALADGTIDVHFQPQREVGSGRICAVEALARWTHPDHGLVPPDVFVGLAEQTGLIGRLTELVLDRSLAAVRHWLDGGREIGVSVNISAQSLVHEQFVDLVAGALVRARVSPHLLTLEITERAMIGDTPRAAGTLHRLDRIGVRLSVDDFGTGYSSLVNLRHLPISELKIDRGFVMGMVPGGSDDVIVDSTVALGHRLGMTVVAEGVETAEIEERLRALGCDVAQGYGISRAIPLDELDRFLERAERRPSGKTGAAVARR